MANFNSSNSKSAKWVLKLKDEKNEIIKNYFNSEIFEQIIESIKKHFEFENIIIVSLKEKLIDEMGLFSDKEVTELISNIEKSDRDEILKFLIKFIGRNKKIFRQKSKGYSTNTEVDNIIWRG